MVPTRKGILKGGGGFSKLARQICALIFSMRFKSGCSKNLLLSGEKGALIHSTPS